MNDSLVSAFLLLLLVCDPVGNIPIFVAALQDVAPERRARIILRECFIAFLILSAAVFVGRPFLRALGLSDVSLQIGGAVVLMLVALRMVFPTGHGVYGEQPHGEPEVARAPAV